MPGDSMVKDFAETLEFYGEHERLGLPPIVLARYLIHSLAGLTDALRALPSVEPATTRNAEAESFKPDGAVGAQESLDFPSSEVSHG